MKENYEWDGGGSLTKRVIGVVPGNTKVNARHYLCNLSLPSILLLIFSFHWFLIIFFFSFFLFVLYSRHLYQDDVVDAECIVW